MQNEILRKKNKTKLCVPGLSGNSSEMTMMLHFSSSGGPVTHSSQGASSTGATPALTQSISHTCGPSSAISHTCGPAPAISPSTAPPAACSLLRCRETHFPAPLPYVLVSPLNLLPPPPQVLLTPVLNFSPVRNIQSNLNHWQLCRIRLRATPQRKSQLFAMSVR